MSCPPEDERPTVTISLEPPRPTLLSQHQARAALALLRNAQDGHPGMADEVQSIRRQIRTVFRLD